MTQAVAGWYPDPAGGPLSRWWDGRQWTDATQPVPAYAAPTYAPAYQPAYPANRTFFQANRYTCLATGFAAAYLLLAVFAHLVVLGIVPVLMSVRAFRAKERYAAASALAAGLALVIGISHLA
jgi:hypothetical protein